MQRVAEGKNRWEWRTFAASPAGFGGQIGRKDGVPPTAVEYYALSLVSPDNVKVRNGSLDIKTLVAVDANGLEQWRPSLKAPFPIDAASLDAARRAWRIPAPFEVRGSCTLNEFFTEVVASDPALHMVRVAKCRTPLIEQGCPGEHVALTIDGEAWESLAFEHVDPLLVRRAVIARRLEGVENQNYPAALKGIVGLRPVGTSTMKEMR